MPSLQPIPLSLIVAASIDAPTVVSSDDVMPEMSGVQLALCLHWDHPNCAVLLSQVRKPLRIC